MFLMMQRENEKCDDCLFVYLEVLCVLNVLCDFTCFMFIFNATCAKRLEIIDNAQVLDMLRKHAKPMQNNCKKLKHQFFDVSNDPCMGNSLV